MFLVLSFIGLWCWQVRADLVVSAVKGPVVLEGRSGPVKKGEILASAQVLVGQDASSHVQLSWDGGRAVLVGKFKLQLRTINQKTKAPSTLSLVYGKMRAQTQVRSKSDPFQVVTPVTVAGVRGTDFMVSYDDVLGESEIVCFESHVEFSNSTTKKSIVVGPGQWGGVGLRFGELREPLTLPPKVLQAIESSISYLALQGS